MGPSIERRFDICSADDGTKKAAPVICIFDERQQQLFADISFAVSFTTQSVVSIQE
jgi:hypothetical protein